MRSTLLIVALGTFSCVPAATRPVRQLTDAALKNVKPAPQFGSAPTARASQEELRAMVEGSFSIGAKKLLRYEPALEGVGRVIGETWSSKGFAPASNVIWWLHWRAGVAGRPSGYRLSSLTSARQTVQLDRALKQWGEQLAASVQEPRAWAIVRFDSDAGDLVQALVTADDSVALQVPRSTHAGVPMKLEGQVRVPTEKLTLHLEDDDQHVRTLEVPIDGEGRFSMPLPAPAKAGRRFLELVRLPPSPNGERVWSRPLALVPLLVDVPEPLMPDPQVSTPRPNPADAGAWSDAVRDEWSQKRAALNLSPVVKNPALEQLAQTYSGQTAQNPDRAPDAQIVERVEQLGVVSREVWEFGSHAEYLDELTWLSWTRPSFRTTLLAPEPPVVGVGITPMADGDFAFTQVIAMPVGKFDVAADVDALRAKFVTLRIHAGKPALQRDATLDAAVQAAAAKACETGGAVDGTLVKEQFAAAKVNGASKWVSGRASRVLPQDLKGFVGGMVTEEGTHFALAACLDATGGKELVVTLVATLEPAAPAPAPAPAKKKSR